MNKISNEEIPTIIQSHFPLYEKQKIKLEPLMGMTNLTLKVTAGELPPLVFRLFGEGFDRIKQNQILKILGESGIAPKMLHFSEDYRIEEFVENAKHPFCPDIFQIENRLMESIIKKTFEFHQVDMPEFIPRKPYLMEFFSQQNYETILKLQKKEPEDQKQFDSLKSQLLGLFDEMKQFYHKHFGNSSPNTIKFCHNDLNNLNIFICQNAQIKLIDYQYSCYNHVAFDIANFLNQFCFAYIEKEPGSIIQRKLSFQDIKNACSYYPQRYENIETDVIKMLVLCNYRWGIWTLGTSRTQSSPQFCPLEHGKTRCQLISYYKDLVAKCID